MVNFSVSPAKRWDLLTLRTYICYTVCDGPISPRHEQSNQQKYYNLPLNNPRTSEAVGPNSGERLGPITNVGRTATRSMLFSLANSQADFSARIFATPYHTYQARWKKQTQSSEKWLERYIGIKTRHGISIPQNHTWILSQNSTELHDVSSSNTLGGNSASSLSLTVDDDDVRTTLLRNGFFLHDLSTFRVPFIAESSISSCDWSGHHMSIKIHHHRTALSSNIQKKKTGSEVIIVSSTSYLGIRFSDDRWCSVEDTLTGHYSIIEAPFF